MADRQYVAPFGNHAAPADWTLAFGYDIPPKLAYAKYDGSGAAGPYKPCLRLISDSGHVACEAVADVVLAAGASADCSWFPGAEVEDEQAQTVAGVILEQLSCHSTQSGGVTSASVLQSGVQYLITVQGTYSLWNLALGTGTPNANAMFPTSDGNARASTQVGLDAECAFAVLTGGGITLGHTSAFKMDLGSGLTHVEPQGGPFATPQQNYLYRYLVTGQGHTVTFKVDDQIGAFLDNYGALQIQIQTFGGSSSGGGGGALLPPDGTDGSFLSVNSGTPFWTAAPASGITTIASPGSTIAVTNPTGPTADLDLPNSGVTAGTFGDSSHVARVTVNAEGIVTGAASVGISGVAGSGLTQLFDTTLGGAAASIDTGANGVAGGHQHLVVIIVCRSSGATNIVDCFMTFNNDSGANYDWAWVRNVGGTVGAVDSHAQTSADVGQMPAATVTANYPSVITVNIPAYAQTTFYKGLTAQGSPAMDATASDRILFMSGTWRNTAAITRIAIAPSLGNLLAGSRLTIYGTQ